MYYSSIALLALLTLLIESHDVFHLYGGQRIQALDAYRKFLLAVMVYYITDVLWGILDRFRLVHLLFLDTAAYYFAMALGLYFWTQYVAAYLNERSAFSKAVCSIGQLLLCAVVSVDAVNFMAPVLFWFDDAGAYHAMPIRYVFLAVQILLFLLSSVYAFSVVPRTKDAEKKRYLTIALFGLSMSVLLFFQLLYPLLPLYSAGYLLGTCLLHSFVLGNEKEEYKRELEQSLIREKRQREELSSAWRLAYTDPMTGVKSKLAYVKMKEQRDAAISAETAKEFAIAVFDLNGLKEINDRKGHEMGDRYIIEASEMICECFRHSPVYRIGGDEFAVLLENADYLNRYGLLEQFNAFVKEQVRINGVIVSVGLADYRKGRDMSCDDVFERADQQMYVRKRELKMA